MQKYLKHTHGQIHPGEILEAAGKTQADLPTLPKYVHPTGRPFLCWASVLGKCGFRNCRFHKEGGQSLPGDITDEFADRGHQRHWKRGRRAQHLGGLPSQKAEGGRNPTLTAFPHKRRQRGVGLRDGAVLLWKKMQFRSHMTKKGDVRRQAQVLEKRTSNAYNN